MKTGRLEIIKKKFLLGIGFILLIIGVSAGSFVVSQQINKWQSSKNSISSETVKGQQIQEPTPTPSISPNPTNRPYKMPKDDSRISPTPTQIPYTPTPIPTNPPPIFIPQPQIDTEFLGYLNNYKAKIEAEIILNTNNLNRYESERQAMIDGYISDGLTPPDWYLETTSRIINNTKARIETLKGLKAKVEEWIARTKAGEVISKTEVDSFVGPLLNQ